MVPLWQDAGEGWGVVRLTENKEVTELVGLFEEIAQEQGWEPGGALWRWTDQSIYFALQPGMRGEPLAGGLQLVLPNASGELPCAEVWPEVPPLFLNHGVSVPCAHIAMLGIAAAYRGDSLNFWRVAVEMWRHCVGAGIGALFIEVTPRVLPLYRRLGWPLKIRGTRASTGAKSASYVPWVFLMWLRRCWSAPNAPSTIVRSSLKPSGCAGSWKLWPDDSQSCSWLLDKP